MYKIKPKHQDEWRKQRSHIKDMGLDVGCIYVEQRCGRSKWEDRCTNLCPCMNCGSLWVLQLELRDGTNNKEVLNSV